MKDCKESQNISQYPNIQLQHRTTGYFIIINTELLLIN